VIKNVKDCIVIDKSDNHAIHPNSVIKFNNAMLRERQRLMVLQAKFELEDLKFEVGLDKISCKYTGYKILSVTT